VIGTDLTYDHAGFTCTGDTIMDKTTSPPPGDMPPEEFRRAGHLLIDWITDYLSTGPGEGVPILPGLAPGDTAARLPASAPATGVEFDRLFADFREILYPGFTHWNSPRYMAYFPSSASGPAVLGELLAAAVSQNCMLWRTSPAGTELEIRVLEWLRDMIGLPASFFGHIVDTASISSMLALAAAREYHHDLAIRTRGMAGRPELPQLTVYASEEAHSSIEKGAITLGFGVDGVRKIATDEIYRMRPDLLREAIEADRAAGRHPLAVVATVGTTSSTSIDPVPAIARICDEYGLWLHVDAAYGGVAAIVPEKRDVLAGCERADSFVVNPHKWLFTPMDCSTFFTRRPEVMRAAFSLVPEYLSSDRDADPALVNLMDYGIQLGRRFRSLKLWLVLAWFGSEGIAERLRHHMALASELAERIEAQEGVELMAPVNFATLCFRFHPGGAARGSEDEAVEETAVGDAGEPDEEAYETFNAAVMNRANESGEVFLSHTKLKGRYTLRLAIGHLRSSAEDVRAVWELLTTLADELRRGQ